MFERKCSRCSFIYSGEDIRELSFYFPKDKRKKFGLSHCCKSCKKEERKTKRDLENARWNRYYRDNPENYKRHKVRVATRLKCGSARKHSCKQCGLTADEWHHKSYDVDDIIPLCHSCHTDIT